MVQPNGPDLEQSKASINVSRLDDVIGTRRSKSTATNLITWLVFLCVTYLTQLQSAFTPRLEGAIYKTLAAKHDYVSNNTTDHFHDFTAATADKENDSSAVKTTIATPSRNETQSK